MKLFEDELFDSVMKKSDLEKEFEMMIESATTPLRPFPIPEEDRKAFMERSLEEIQDKYSLPTSLEKYAKEATNCEELAIIFTEAYLRDDLGETEFKQLTTDFNKFIQESLETEFSIGAMLPQPGEGGDISDLDILNEEDELLDLELESAISYYINDPELEYNAYTEAAVINAVKGLKDKIVGKVKISTKLYKAMVQRAMLKCKLKSAQRKNTDKKLINDLKQQLVQKEQEVRTLKVGIDPQSIEEIDRVGQKIEAKIAEKEEKEMQAIANQIIANPNLVAVESTEESEDGDITTEAVNPFTVVPIIIAGGWITVTGIVAGLGAEDIKSKQELKYIEKYYEKNEAGFIPFKKAKKKNFKLDKSFDNIEFGKLGGKGKEIGKIRNLIGNKVTILFNNKNEEICSYALSVDTNMDLVEKSIKFKINKKYAKYDNYYISAICFKHGVQRRKSIAWIHKEYKRIKKLKKEKTVKESTMIENCYDENLITEAYFGRSPILQQAEVVLGKLIREIKNDPLADYTNSKLNKEFESLMKKQFGFDKFFMIWKRGPRVMANAFTLFSSDIIWNGDKIVNIDKKKGFYDKSHSHVCYIQSYQTMIAQLDLSAEEMMGILLHEMGHNFDRSFYYILTVLRSYVRLIFEPVTQYITNFDGFGNPYTTTINTVVPRLKVQWIQILTSTGFGKNLLAAWNSFTENILTKIPVLKKLSYTLGRVGDFLLRQFERIAAIPNLLYMPVIALVSPWFHLSKVPVRKMEEFSDSFATSYGYGAACASALVKIEATNLLDYDIKSARKDNPLVRITTDFAMTNRYLISVLMGADHGSNDTRMHNMLRQLEADIKNANYPKDLEKELMKEYKKLRKTYSDYFSAGKNERLCFTAMTRGFVNRVFNGESDFIAKLFPENTVNSVMGESVNDMVDLLLEQNEIELKLESAQYLPTEKVVRYENQLKALNRRVENISQYITEAANIEKEMKPIIEQLNAKGYKTKYSSPGHTKLRKKEDMWRDGVYEGKLYSDARIMFDGDYNFPKAPKYWIWKTVDGNDYLDVDPKAYNIEKGFTPSEMFDKWKTAYMGTLKTWVENLPDQTETKKNPIVKDTKGRETVVESQDIDQIFEDFFKESMNDIDLDLMELGVESTLK